MVVVVHVGSLGPGSGQINCSFLEERLQVRSPTVGLDLLFVRCENTARRIELQLQVPPQCAAVLRTTGRARRRANACQLVA